LAVPLLARLLSSARFLSERAALRVPASGLEEAFFREQVEPLRAWAALGRSVPVVECPATYFLQMRVQAQALGPVNRLPHHPRRLPQGRRLQARRLPVVWLVCGDGKKTKA